MPKSPSAAMRLVRLCLPFWRWILLSMLLGFATIGSSIALMGTSAWLIAKAALQPSLADLNLAIVGVRFFGLSRGVFRYLERVVSHQTTFRLLKAIRVDFYTALEPLAPARLSMFRRGDLLSRIISDIDTLQNFYIRVLAPPLIAIITALAMAGFTFTLAPTLTLIFILFVLLLGIVWPLIAYRASRQFGRQVVEARAELKTTILDSVQGLADVLAFGKEGEFKARIDQQQGSVARSQSALTQIEDALTAAGTTLVGITVALLLFVAIPRIEPIYLAPLALTAMASFEAFLPLTLAAIHLSATREAANRLFEILDAEPAVCDPATPVDPPSTYDLAFERVTLTYPDTDQKALYDVTFTLEPGQKIAIVGPSGAGKSTIAHLLARFWDADAGEILLGGHLLKNYVQSDLRNWIGFVPQRIHLFNTTVRENIQIATPHADEDAILEAARQAHIHDFITSLPDGYDTWVGEHGMRLSGGERQRLALARLFLKDPPVIVLDEALNHIDSVIATDIMETMFAVWQAASVLFITHRLGAMERMDHILVMRTGRIIETGTHQELLENGGFYANMWQQQHSTV